jgi:hypothetical protein
VFLYTQGKARPIPTQVLSSYVSSVAGAAGSSTWAPDQIMVDNAFPCSFGSNRVNGYQCAPSGESNGKPTGIGYCNASPLGGAQGLSLYGGGPGAGAGFYQGWDANEGFGGYIPWTSTQNGYLGVPSFVFNLHWRGINFWTNDVWQGPQLVTGGGVLWDGAYAW